MFRKLCLLTGLLCTATTHAGDLTCKQLRAVAVKQCAVVRQRCMDVSICKDIRKNCPQDVGSPQGCQAFGACARKNTPPIFSSVCMYAPGDASGGTACRPVNGLSERVAYTCPGFNTKVGEPPSDDMYNLTDSQRKAVTRQFLDAGQYDDPSFSCVSQKWRYYAELGKCEAAIRHFYYGCSNDPGESFLSSPSCEDAEDLFSHVLSSTFEVTVSDSAHQLSQDLAVDKKLPYEWSGESFLYNGKAMQIRFTQKGINGAGQTYRVPLGDIPTRDEALYVDVHLRISVRQSLTGYADVYEWVGDTRHQLLHKTFGPMSVYLPNPEAVHKPK